LSGPAGEIEVEARLTQGIHPRTVALADSTGHWGYGRIAQAKKFKSKYPETECIWWTAEGNGVHPNRVISLKIDPLGGGQAWMDTRVRVKKA